MIHKELWEKYGVAEGLSDMVMKTHLTIDREESGEAPYSPTAADEVISTYRVTLAFAGLTESGKVDLQLEDTAANDTKDLSERQSVKAKIGDYVRWISSGVIQFDARKVDWISEDGSHLRVFGSPTGIPMDQIELVKPPMNAPTVPSVRAEEAPTNSTGGTKGLKINVTAYVEKGRLQLTADVGADEIADLRDMLEKYEAILKMLN